MTLSLMSCCNTGANYVASSDDGIAQFPCDRTAFLFWKHWDKVAYSGATICGVYRFQAQSRNRQRHHHHRHHYHAALVPHHKPPIQNTIVARRWRHWWRHWRWRQLESIVVLVSWWRFSRYNSQLHVLDHKWKFKKREKEEITNSIEA